MVSGREQSKVIQLNEGTFQLPQDGCILDFWEQE